jgi:putative transposase
MRGVSLSYETIREWRLKFGQIYANGLGHKSSRPGDRWHLDEVFLKINGQLHVRHEVAFVTVMLG